MVIEHSFSIARQTKDSLSPYLVLLPVTETTKRGTDAIQFPRYRIPLT